MGILISKLRIISMDSDIFKRGTNVFKFFKRKTTEKILETINKLSSSDDITDNLDLSYEAKLKRLHTIFKDDDLMQFRQFKGMADHSCRFCAVYCEGLSNSELIDAHIIKPIMLSRLAVSADLATKLTEQVIQIDGITTTKTYQEAIVALTYGDTLLIIEGSRQALVLSTKSFPARSINEPENDKILSGPREGFTEILVTNLAMIRRKLRTHHLKMQYRNIGKETQTQICIAYLDNIVDQAALAELIRRLETINIDGILDANYLVELIRDNRWSPFKSIGHTERPDVAVGKLLEGRVAVFVDGTPVVLTLPYLFIENFQNSEDYYINFYYTTFSRFLRILGFLITIITPGLYIAIVAFHREALPASLIVSIAMERQNVPLPAALEALFMMLIFDILRESSVRMPSNTGQALSIVGALVLGQAAVEAKLVAAPMIIMVATTGITSLLIPKMNAAVICMRFGILGLASCLGFLGMTLGLSLITIHILNLHSFGVAQLTFSRGLRYQELKDTVIRAPWWQMLLRPTAITTNEIRQDKPKGDES